MSALRASLPAAAALLLVATTGGWWSLRDGDLIPGTEPISIGTPKRDNPVNYVSGSPALTAGIQNWALRELGSRIEPRPPLLGMHRWGPVARFKSGCGLCSGEGGRTDRARYRQEPWLRCRNE